MSAAPVIPPPAVWLEEALVFCRCGSLLEDRYGPRRVKCCVACLGVAGP